MEWKVLEEEFELNGSIVLDWMDQEFARIRSGRVSLNILDIVKVEAYGEFMNLNQVANLQIVDARQILIKPYDRAQMHDIAKAISASPLGVSPQVNADNIRLIFPTQTEENRIQKVKKAKEILEQAKQKMRDVRKEVQGMYKKLQGVSEDLLRYFEDELNNITKAYNNKLEESFNKKEAELMTI